MRPAPPGEEQRRQTRLAKIRSPTSPAPPKLVVPGDKHVCGAAVADFDNDDDTDIAVAGPDGAWLFSNLRGGKFGVSAPFAQAKGTAVATADLDGGRCL